MRSGVEDHVRAVGGHDPVDAAGIADAADERDQVQLAAVLAGELLLDGVGIVLVYVKDDEGLGVAGCDLAAELGADGAAATRDEDGPSLEAFVDLREVHGDLVAAEEVFDLHVTELGDADLAVDQLVDAGEGLHGYARVVADTEDVLAGPWRGRGDGEDDGGDVVLGHELGDLVAPSLHANVVDVTALLGAVVIHEADDLGVQARGEPELADDHLARNADTDDEGALPRGGGVVRLGAERPGQLPLLDEDAQQAVAKATCCGEGEGAECTVEVEADGQLTTEREVHDKDTGLVDNGGVDEVAELNDAGKGPDAVVEAEVPERSDAHDDHGHDHAGKRDGLQRRNGREVKVVTGEQGKAVRHRDGEHVREHEKQSALLPLLVFHRPVIFLV